MASGRLSELVDKGYHPIITCEGTAEEVMVNLLVDANSLVFPSDSVVEVTRSRRARDIQERFLNYDYDRPVCVARIHDSRNERFRLDRLYADRYPVVDVLTHPEIEALVIAREGEWANWRRSGLKPSDYCKQRLGMKDVKSRSGLLGYWDAGAIAYAAKEYKRPSSLQRGEYCLADLIGT